MSRQHTSQWSDGAAGPLLAAEERWRDRAQCSVEGLPEDFFQERGNVTGTGKAICARCPVLSSCREYVMEAELGFGLQLRHGIWAGMTPQERHQMDRSARRTHVAGRKQAA
jgi:hypothetical protein